MKIRNGFVSNSSSSSFALLGEEIDIYNIDPKSFKKKVEYLAEMEDFEYGEGRVCMWIKDAESLDFIQKHGHVSEVWEVFAYAYDSREEIDITNIPKNKKIKLHTFTIDQHSPEDIESIKEAYEYAGFFDADEDDDESGGTSILLKKRIMLKFVSGNSNKFYEMTDTGDGSFQVRYGRTGQIGSIIKYDISMWDSKYNEKINKGYHVEKIEE